MRIFMGIVWFVVFFVILYLVFSIVFGMIAVHGVDTNDMQAGMKAGIEFAREHAVALSVCRWSIFVLSVLLAVFGTWKRVLPGTRKKQPEKQTESAA
jgi:uncharacterized BrkB/YihY/UPF0761 family membrane protein